MVEKSKGAYTLTVSRYGELRTFGFDTLEEAIEDAAGSIEFNTARPLRIEHDGHTVLEGRALIDAALDTWEPLDDDDEWE